ncbi:MAG: AMP-binding protein, partial [Acidobacteriota bacterium]
MQNIFDCFAHSAERFPSQVAVELQRRHTVEQMTYCELADVSERATAFAADLGCRPGDRCAILAENDARWLGIYLGLLRLGAVAVPL